jgi:5-methylcytosine-specific restriction endonuclease McrA
VKRGQPLRRTPLARGVSVLRRTGPLRAVSSNRQEQDPALAKVRPHMGLKPIPLKARKAVRERDQYRCVAGGCWVGETGGHIHHRKLRSQGGDNSVDNLILLCAQHHNAIHHNVELAYQLGYLVRSWDNPAAVQIAARWPDAA